MSPRFLGLSTGRAGSRYLTRILNKAGIPACHEKTFGTEWRERGVLGEVTAHLVVHVDRWPRAKIWHFSRHPQPFVSSLLKFGFWRLHAPSIHPYLRRTGDDLADSYRYWVDWNERLLAVPEPRRTSFRIEDVDRAVIERLAATIGEPAEVARIAPRWRERQAFAPIPRAVEPEVRAMMDRLGYA